MSNPAVIKLERNHVNKSMVWLDDNFGESIHIHIDDIRVDLTVEEFKELNDDIGIILNDLLQIENFDITKIDPVYLSLWLWPSLSRIARVEISTANLGDLLVRSMDGKRIIPLKDSVEVKALTKASCENDMYKRKSNHIGQTDTQRLQDILNSIRTNGYPYDEKYIVLFGDENFIRDGQHRASCLYYLYGSKDIPVMRIFLKDMMTSKKPKFYQKRFFYNSKIGYALRITKKYISIKVNLIFKDFKTMIKAFLRSIGINRRFLERDIKKLDCEIDSFNAR